MKIIALSNFGHEGRDVQKGEIVDVDPGSFGGTYDGFKEAGLLHEITDAQRAQVEPLPQVKRVPALRELIAKEREKAPETAAPVASPAPAAPQAATPTVAAPQAPTAPRSETTGAQGQP